MDGFRFTTGLVVFCVCFCEKVSTMAVVLLVWFGWHTSSARELRTYSTREDDVIKRGTTTFAVNHEYDIRPS